MPRRGLAMPRADLAENYRGIVRAHQGIAIPRQGTIEPPVVGNTSRQGMATAPDGEVGARHGMLDLPPGVSMP